MKPRFGRGSRDVFSVDDPDDLAFALRRVPDPIVQTRLVGREFTVDALVDRDGHLAGAVPRWRLETKAGISTKGETFADAAVVNGVARLLAAVGLTGPANVQGFVDPNGGASFIEVNPRFSGGLPLVPRRRRRPGRRVPPRGGGQGRPAGAAGVPVGRGHDAPLRGGLRGMKVLVPFGTRPEIIKLAPVVRALVEAGLSVRTVATGQHYDEMLTDAFFEGLRLRPDTRWSLSGSEGERLGA